MERMKVNKEVFKALMVALNKWDEDTVMELHVTENWDGEFKPLRTLHVTEMARALYTGYDLEFTPEEYILDYYNTANDLERGGDHEMKLENQAKMDAVLFVLNKLGKEIEGINK